MNKDFPQRGCKFGVVARDRKNSRKKIPGIFLKHARDPWIGFEKIPGIFFKHARDLLIGFQGSQENPWYLFKHARDLFSMFWRKSLNMLKKSLACLEKSLTLLKNPWHLLKTPENSKTTHFGGSRKFKLRLPWFWGYLYGLSNRSENCHQVT